MKKIKLKVVSCLLSSVMLISTLGFANKTVNADAKDTFIPVCYAAPKVDTTKLEEFVTRLYSVCLGRKPDKAGLDSWVKQLSNREQTGVSCAYGFIFSDEFQNKSCSNKEYVQYMYDAFFGRKADEVGLNTWVQLLDDGIGRDVVFSGFANSEEFAKLCAKYGVVRGDYIDGYDWQQTAKVNLFVDRLYSNTLGRYCDVAGMTSWTELLLSKEWSGAQVAYGFIFSKEFDERNLCNDCYVKILYEAFMGRSADSAGFKMWVTNLVNGSSREDVFNGFVGSNEFTTICESYGIDRGPADFTGSTIKKGSFTCSSCGNTYKGMNCLEAIQGMGYRLDSNLSCKTGSYYISTDSNFIDGYLTIFDFNVDKVSKIAIAERNESNKNRLTIVYMEMDSEQDAINFVATCKKELGFNEQHMTGSDALSSYDGISNDKHFETAFYAKLTGSCLSVQVVADGSTVRLVECVYEKDNQVGKDLKKFYDLLGEDYVLESLVP